MSRLRRSMLFVPGNNPGMIRDAHIYGSDCIMFDLEDSVSINEKDAARFLVYKALTSLRYGKKELVVRINSLDDFGVEDLEAIVRARPHVIRLPKTETAQDVTDCETEIARIEREAGIPEGSTGMMAAIEGPKGVLNAYEIARSSKRLIGIALGAEDYVTSMRTVRSPEGIELLFARSMLVNAARAAGIDALDTVYSDVNNEEGFVAEAQLIKKLGFDGKSVINPRQIAPLHAVFSPSEKDIAKAKAIMEAIAEAELRGSGVASLNGKMIDKPVVERARYMLERAQALNIPIEEV
ncbi:MAG: aldolase/citrate lyase family protein [Candidatus Gastranaerophilaceae bacterium]|mgnify:CR=1 FL=1|nr:aldolase/citrate lyase family protein [Christensenellales bacterium]